MVRFPEFISAEEVELIRDEALRHRASHPDAGGTLYLQHEGLHPLLAPIVERIHDRVWRLDAEVWGLNAVHDLEGVSGLHHRPANQDAAVSDSDEPSASWSFCTSGAMQPRTIEFHEYGTARGRKVCCNHCDHGSLFTADVMLSPTNEFEGGGMVTTVVEEGKAATHMRHAFEKGDLLVFPAHKPHSVERVTSGTRTVFVVEFWRGPACTCNARCMGACRQKALRSSAHIPLVYQTPGCRHSHP